MSITGCQCPVAGYCERHRIEKPGRLHELCQSDQRYFDRWEALKDTPAAKVRQAARDSRIELFHKLWLELHTYQWTSEGEACRWYAEWKKRIPRFGCKCRRHWEEIEAALPEDFFVSADAFFAGGVWAHNQVNDRLQKPVITLEAARQIYCRCCR